MAKNVVTLRQGPYGVKDDDDMFDSDVSIKNEYALDQSTSLLQLLSEIIHVQGIFWFL